MKWNRPENKKSPEELKILFIDVDGTLVSFKTHEPAEGALAALEKVQQNGLKVCLATGRSYDAIGALRELPFDAFVCSSGQNALLADGTVIRRVLIDPEDVEAVLNYIDEREEKGLPARDFVFIGVEDTYFSHLNPETERLFNNLHFGNYRLRDREFLRSGEWVQLMFIGDEQEQGELMPRLPHSIATRWHPDFIDIMPREGGKGDGIKAVCEFFGLDPSSSVAFGDGENDISMFREAGIVVAMGNASDATKEEADLITFSVDDDGLRLALRELGLW